MLGETQNAVRGREGWADLNLYSQLLGHWAHGFIPDHRFFLQAEQYRSNSLYCTL